MARRHSHEPGWARGRSVLAAALRTRAPGTKYEIGFLKRLGHGLSREAYVAEVTGPEGVLDLVVLVPREDVDRDYDERVRTEARLLDELATLSLPFRTPRIFATHADDAGRTTLIQHWEPGAAVDLREGRGWGSPPWSVVGRAAAAIHALPTTRFAWLQPAYATRREHALAAIAELDGMEEPVVAAARAWMTEHVPDASPGSLLHGDLLGQNILQAMEGTDCVIDWERAMVGDPAYDLAIVTRGARRPFQSASGMTQLLESYAEAGGASIRRAEVHLHELALRAGFYRAALRGESAHPPETELQNLRSLLDRVSR